MAKGNLHSNFWQRHQTMMMLSGIMLLALLFRLFLFRYRFAIGFDEPHYLQLAMSGRLNGLREMCHPYWPPVFPAFIALFSWVISDLELAGRLASAFMGSALVVPIFYLTGEFYPRRVATISALLIACNPLLAFMNTSIMVESTFMMLAISGIALSWQAVKRGSVILVAIAAMLWSAAYLTRPDGIGFLLIFLGFLPIRLLFQRQPGQWKKTVVFMAIAVACFAITSAPYVAYLHQQIGKWSLSLKWEVGRIDIDQFRSLSNDNHWLPVDMAYHLGDFTRIHELPEFSQQMQTNHYLALKEKAENFYQILNGAIPRLLSSFLLILLTVGICRVNFTSDRIWLTVYLIAILSFFWFVVVPLFYVNDRYLIPVLPLCFIWIGQGLDQLYRWLLSLVARTKLFAGQQMSQQLLVGLGISGLVLGLAYLPDLGRVVTLERHSRDIWTDAIEHRKAGEWLKHQSPTPPILMAQNHSIDFYAGNYNIRESINIPRNEWPRVLEYARYRQAQYLIINERYCQEWYPELLFLLREENIPAELKLVYKNIDPVSGLKLLIYQFTSSAPMS
ncbi:MAG: glycosyltransferase family 39 protein [candidate division KSB1 bacterium]|nr:glycosyltransferase family 39 protein [candidate division KSB1 bacterium]